MVDEAGTTEVYPFEVVSGVATALALGPTNVYFTDMTETIWAMRRSDQTLHALTVRDSEVRDIVFHQGRIYWARPPRVKSGRCRSSERAREALHKRGSSLLKLAADGAST
jgi:hypothetical protein